MPQGVPERLDAMARALYSSIGSYITAGVGADRVYKILSEQGIDITRREVRAIAGEQRTSLSYRRDLAVLDPRNPIPLNKVRYTDALQTDNFVHTVKMILADTVTGYQVSQYYNYVSPSIATKDQIFDSAREMEDSPGDSWAGLQIISMTLIDVSHRG